MSAKDSSHGYPKALHEVCPDLNEGEVHPSEERLFSYAAREVPDAEAEELRDHLSECSRCAQLVLEIADLPDIETEPGDADEPRVSVAWESLQERIHNPKPTDGACEEPIRGAPPVETASASGPWMYKLVVSAVAAGLLLVVGVVGRQMGISAAEFRVTEPQEIFIHHSRAVSDAETVYRGDRPVNLRIDPPSDLLIPTYRVEVRSANGDTVLSDTFRVSATQVVLVSMGNGLVNKFASPGLNRWSAQVSDPNNPALTTEYQFGFTYDPR